MKFIYSEKATKFCKISTFLLSYVLQVKSKVEISQNLVAFSEYMNFKERVQLLEKAMFKDNCTQDLGNKINKSDPNYGKPQQGTLTEFRGQKAHTHVHKVRSNCIYCKTCPSKGQLIF